MSEPLADAAARPAARWEDFVDVFTAPASVFARRRDGRFGAALAVLTALTAAVFFATRPLLQPLIDRQFDLAIEQMRRNPQMTAQQIEGARAGMERFAAVSTPFFAVLGTPVLVLVLAALVWAAARLVGARLSYGQAATVTTYANVPRVLGGILGAALLAVKDPATLAPVQAAPLGPALLLGPDASLLVTALAQRFDLVTLWVTVLLGIGVAVVGKVDRGRGLMAAGGVWLVATLWAVLSALRTTAAMGG